MPTVLQSYSFHTVPTGTDLPVRETTGAPQSVEDYLKDLVAFLSDENTSVRSFHFDEGRQPEAKTQFCVLPESESFNAAADALATRLHGAQQDAAVGAIEIQGGDLLTMVYATDGKTFILLAKLEQVSFLNRLTWQKDAGFPFEKNRLLKTCLCEMVKKDDAWTVEDVTIYDSNSTISRFWWHGFLELTETTNDASNSKRAYAAWREFIDKEVRPISKQDSHILRNAIGMYFRNKQPYVHADAVTAVLANYTPEHADLEMNTLSEKALKLPQMAKALGKRFDSNFEIDPRACNIRSSPIKLTPDIDLVIKGPVQDFKDLVKGATIGGKNGVFVVSEEGYKEVTSS